MVAALKFPPISRRNDDTFELEPRMSPVGPAANPFADRMRDRQPSVDSGYMRIRSRRNTERRVFERKAASGRVSGRRTDHSVCAHKMPYLNLNMSDISVGGMRAQSQEVVEPGEHVVVFFPPQGTQMGWDAYGRVVRCLPKGHGYEIALEFDPLPAA